MGEKKFTPSQEAAVKDRSGTLLVAAAAGSGKTTVLTSRILDKLTMRGETADISEFLIVTFTKAATGELREKLYSGLIERIKDDPGNTRARRQLSLINLAKISTIHSFCFDIIKQNFEALSLPSNLRIGEQTELDVLLKSTLEEIAAEKYESEQDGSLFLKSVEILSGARSDDGFFEGLINLYRKLRGISEPYRKYEGYLEKYREAEECTELFDTEFGRLIKSNLRFELEGTLSELDGLLYDINNEPAIAKLLFNQVSDDREFFESVLYALDRGYEEARKSTVGFIAKRAGKKNGEIDLEYFEALKDKRKKCIAKCMAAFESYLGAGTELVKTAAKESRLVLEEILQLIKELDARYSEKKLERSLLDYSDLEQYALKLLVADTGEFGGSFRRTELAKAISESYKEIYIDEYQDTNSVQDMIFRAVATYDGEKGTEKNRFLVGDIKQSIYRFRGAEPDIFASYIKLFGDLKSDTEGKETAHKLYLSNNFRCSRGVIDFTNQVFDCIMEGYTADDRLIYSKKEGSPVDAPAELVLISCPKDSGASEGEKLSEEALYIAHRIQEMAYNPQYRSEKGKVYEYSDFAIITRSLKGVAEDYRRAFRQAGIPLSADVPENFFELPEVLLALCLLNCVDNPQRDIYTAGVMHSPLFMFNADELCEIRKCGRNMSYYSCCEKFAAEAGDGALSAKVKEFIEAISGFRKLSRGTPTDVLISELFTKTGLFDLYSGKNSEKRKNIMRIYEMARGFEKTSFRGLSAFLDYLSDKAQGESDFRSESEKNSVKLMSIHRSKGLEYPVVFIPRAASRFNTQDENTPIIFSQKQGIGITLRDTSDSQLMSVNRNFVSIKTPFREAIRSSERQDMIEEEKRLLYVAMTRARDRLIITAKTDDLRGFTAASKRKNSGGYEAYGKYAMSFLDFLVLALSPLQLESLLERNESDAVAEGLLKCYRVDAGSDYLAGNSKTKPAEVEESLDSALIESYAKALEEAKTAQPYSSVLSGVAAKISVSRLKKGLLDEEQSTSPDTELKALPRFMQEQTEADAAERGTATHTFMQFASYENLEKNGAASEADRLLSLGFIDRRMREIVDLDALDGFVKSKLYSDIKKAPKLYRERRFNLKLDASEFTEKDSTALHGEFILVQGVSDLYFVGDDGNITLVDFKTDRVAPENGEQVLRQRHSAQLSYYKRAIQEITGIPVSKVYLYSFSLNREVLLDV